jgi:hypothetical protein
MLVEMQTDLTTTDRSALAAMFQARIMLPALLIVAIVAGVAIEPLAALAAAGGIGFLVAYFYRRDWLVGGVFVALILQNLVYQRLLPVNPPLAALVKHADDFLTVFFIFALAAETVFPTLRLSQVPLWRPAALLLAICLLSAVHNHLTPRAVAIGTYVLLKNFIWFFLAASIRLDDRGYRNVFRFLIVVLGGILAFGFVQFATGDLTYNLLGLQADYRFGIVRLRSIFIRPVYLSEAMALLAVLAASAYIEFRRTVYLTLVLGALVAVALTMLVKTVMALGLAVGFLLLRKRPWLIVPYAVGAAVATGSFAEYGTENVRFQFATYLESPRSVRREGYRIGGEILRDSPLLGAGPGMFGGYAATVLDSPIPARYDFINYDNQDYSSIDAFWPHLAGEVGLIGLAVFVWLLWSAGRASWQTSTRATISPYARTLAMTAGIFLLVASIEAFASANFEDSFCGFMIFSMLGLTQGDSLPRGIGQARENSS